MGCRAPRSARPRRPRRARRAVPGRLLAALRAGTAGAPRADPDGELGDRPPVRQLPVGRSAAVRRLPRPQRRHLHRHGRPRVRPDPLAQRPGDRRTGRWCRPGPASRDPGRPGRRQRPGDRAVVRRRHRVRLAGPLLPRRRHGPGRGLRDARRGAHRLPRSGGRRAGPARRARRQAEGFATFASGGPCSGATGAGRGRGARGGRASRRGACRRARPWQAADGAADAGDACASGSSATGRWAGPTATATASRRASRTCRCAGRQADLRTRRAAPSRPPRRPTARSWTTDWRDLVGRDDIDMVDICTPPGTHAEIAEAAAAAGKAVLSEKPLGASYGEAHAAWPR